ncbi:MAG: hypothetical protein [Microviridae sp.]|nr:MAG: hypothetical protein [Microviridae sp.]
MVSSWRGPIIMLWFLIGYLVIWCVVPVLWTERLYLILGRCPICGVKVGFRLTLFPLLPRSMLRIMYARRLRVAVQLHTTVCGSLSSR